jgi:hypothetical protein
MRVSLHRTRGDTIRHGRLRDRARGRQKRHRRPAEHLMGAFFREVRAAADRNVEPRQTLENEAMAFSDDIAKLTST